MTNEDVGLERLEKITAGLAGVVDIASSLLRHEE